MFWVSNRRRLMAAEVENTPVYNNLTVCKAQLIFALKIFNWSRLESANNKIKHSLAQISRSMDSDILFLSLISSCITLVFLLGILSGVCCCLCRRRSLTSKETFKPGLQVGTSVARGSALVTAFCALARSSPRMWRSPREHESACHHG